MDAFSTDLVILVYQLLPGFLAAWLFHSLTAHPKPEPFERVVNALIFTIIVRALAILTRELLFAIGTKIAVGKWADEVDLILSVLIATTIGLVFALCANNDFPHNLLRSLGWTKRTSFPSEWYSAFQRGQRYVVLHWSNGRRLYGWPTEWSDYPDKGHFILEQCRWLLKDGSDAPLYNVAKILIRAEEVEMVEFLKAETEIPTEPAERQRVKDVLVQLQRKELGDGDKSTTTTSK